MSSGPSSCIIFLIGMPAVGKTYWAKKVAEEHKMAFADLDQRIVDREKLTIHEMFTQYGEAGFREREAQALRHITSNSSCGLVIACGGGTPCYNDNLQHMKTVGIVVYLRSGIPLLLSHLQNSRDARPLLQCEDPELALRDLLTQRKNIYEQADYIVDAENLSLATFDKIVLSCTKRH